jgi:ubiquinone/menaquinone biosynthesis C-methylase UbiE
VNQDAPLPVAAGKSSFDLIDQTRFFAALALRPDAVVLDLACGPGHYALELARRLPRGQVHALDLWPEGVGQLRAAAVAAGLDRIQAAVADAGRGLPLKSASIDLCLAATVLHDLVVSGAAQTALAEIVRVLKPGGIFAAVEFEKVASAPGPPPQIRLAPAELEALVGGHGFHRRRLEPAGDHLYLMLFDHD